MRPSRVVGGLARLLMAVLQEIFDEAAYARFLRRHGIDSSREAYAAFLREAAAEKEKKPRCC